ncbi:MAG: ABC transporter permease [Oscillospiraceae bacterium]|nr:ABC transporter permease [Oscillospiraceae bacterium]
MKKRLRSVLPNRNLMIGIIMVFLVVIVALFAEQLAPYPYTQAHLPDKMQGPSSTYPFGTDEFGRDMLSRVIYGTRPALRVAFLAMLIEVGIGVTLGLLAGYYGGVTDYIVTFIGDLTWCVPPIVLTMAVIAVIGKGLDHVIIATALVSWAQYTRVVRAKTQSLRYQAFVETAIAFNERDGAIMLRYILPNIVPSIIVLASLSIPLTIMSTTALSFLGMGAQPPSPDWGLALSNGFTYITTAPWLAVFPGLALVYTVFAFNLLGEGMRDWLDPRMKD